MTVLVTAKQAYPAFEGLFLEARADITLGFRIFDPLTPLHSTAARAVGDTWVDLIVATLNRGVTITMTLSDFDPIAGYGLHRDTWKAARILLALNEMTNEGAARFSLTCMRHPAQGGLFARLLFAPQTRKKLRAIARDLNDNSKQDATLRFLPALREMLEKRDETVTLKPWTLPKIYPVTLHQKMAIFDGETTYIGGLDLNARRYDDHDHNRPAQETWHDVQLILRDTALAQDSAAFLRTLPATVTGQQPPPAIRSRLCTTLSRMRHNRLFGLAPETVSDGLLQAHLAAIRAARTFIYIETQYFRDRRIAAALAEAGRKNPKLSVLMLLPAAPEVIAFETELSLDARYGEYLQARAIKQVRKVFGDRFYIVSPVQPRAIGKGDSKIERAALADAPIVYVHAKVSIFDDTCAIVGSANLNGRSLKWDTETGVVINDCAQVKTLRDAAFQHWLPSHVDPSYFAIDTAFDSWVQLAKLNASQRPANRQGFVMPYDLTPAKAAALAVPGAPEELI